jgi:hypothetical protein
MIWIHGTKSEQSDRLIPMTAALRDFLLRLKADSNPLPGDRITKIDSAKKCLATACAKLEFPKFSHHDFRHFFATTCIESGVDIPTVSRWLGHSDGGALAMRVYGHLQVEHSLAMGKRVNFEQAVETSETPALKEIKQDVASTGRKAEKLAIAKAKAKYSFPWWASQNPIEVFWGQLNEKTMILPTEKFLEVAKQAMGREVLHSELADRESLLDELSVRTRAETLDEISNKIVAKNQTITKSKLEPSSNQFVMN